MADNYSQCTPDRGLRCTEAQSDALEKALDVADEDDGHGFECDYDGEEFYFYAEDYVNMDALPSAFLKLVGELLTEQGLPYMQLGYAYTCSKMRTGEFGGGYARIYPDGKLVWPETLWPGENKRRRKREDKSG